jgi:voltage-gated potassium channel Kch
MRKITFGDRLRYWFDNSLSAGTISLIGWLTVITLVIIAVGTFIVSFFDLLPDEQKEGGVAESIWQTAMRSIDAGTVAGDTDWTLRIVFFLVTLGGIFIVSALIGVLTSGLESKLEDLRKGRSFVVEENHTLILGWSSHIFLVIKELAIANENQRRPRVVILADKDKVEMEDEIRAKVSDLKNTKIVCRSGSPIDLDDLEIVNPHAAKSIIILSPEDAADPDSQVIKMILALTNNPNRKAANYHIVAEIRHAKNMHIARLVGGQEAKIILSSQLISRITVQTCRQTGLSLVYKDLLDFGGDEIVFQPEPQLAGKNYAQALSAYDDCAVIGLRRKEGVKLNPPMSTIIQGGDEIVAIAEDDDKVKLSGMREIIINANALRENRPTSLPPEKLLILGWNHRGISIVRELDNYVAEGSQLTVVSEIAETDAELSEITNDLKNLILHYENGDITDRKLLDSMDLTSYQHIIILCYADHLSIQEADSKTLMTLLHLRDIEKNKGEAFSVVSEMLDVKNRALAEVAKADDFIVSEELTGLMLTQISENGNLQDVFDDLFDADGAEIYLKPITDFIITDEPVNFYTILESAKKRGETAIGYRLMKESEFAEKSFGVCLNPKKSEVVKFANDDKVIVLAES